jgi:hypothetical protein
MIASLLTRWRKADQTIWLARPIGDVRFGSARYKQFRAN